MRGNFNNKRSGSGSRGSFGGGHGFGGRSFGRGGGKARGFSGLKIDESKFINKASVNNNVVDYVSTNKFSDYKIDEQLKNNITQKGYIKPTAIQDKAISEILEGKDIIGMADTGTGKTAAFLIPLIDKIIKNKRERVLIMAPTRELALQINQEFRDFAKGLNIYSVAIVGGASMREQIMQLRRGCNVLIGTPGRLKDLIERKIINLNECKNVVLDEADRMLDMGFINDIKLILGQMFKEKQTLLFCATLSREIENLSQSFLKNPVKIETKIRDTSSNVDQDVIRIGMADDKTEILHDLLIKENFKKVLIFGTTKMGVERLSNSLNARGFKTVSIHGDKTHSNRQFALKLFKENKIQIMVATDVAARGLDIPEVSHVINYDIPKTYEDYIHRIGRTGRADKKGIALTFVGKKASDSAVSSAFGGRTKHFTSRSSGFGRGF